MPIETIVSMKFCVGYKAKFCEQRNFCLVCVLLAGWLGEVNLRKSVARDFYCGTHVVSLDCLPQI